MNYDNVLNLTKCGKVGLCNTCLKNKTQPTDILLALLNNLVDY